MTVGRGRRSRDGLVTVSASASPPYVDVHLGAAVAVTGGVRQRLLEDAVRRLVDSRSERPARAVDARARRRGPPCGGGRPASSGRRGRAAAPPRRSPRGTSSSRSARTSWSISPSVSRATSSIVSSAARERSGSARRSSRAAPAWTRITLIAWPAESCRSRAIRVRSSAAASRRSRSAPARRARRAPRARRSARAAAGRGRRAPRRRPRRRRRTAAARSGTHPPRMPAAPTCTHEQRADRRGRHPSAGELVRRQREQEEGRGRAERRPAGVAEAVEQRAGGGGDHERPRGARGARRRAGTSKRRPARRRGGRDRARPRPSSLHPPPSAPGSGRRRRRRSPRRRGVRCASRIEGNDGIAPRASSPRRIRAPPLGGREVPPAGRFGALAAAPSVAVSTRRSTNERTCHSPHTPALHARRRLGPPSLVRVFPLFWITAIALFWFFVWRRRWRRDPLDSARQILAERYARDELSADDYRKRLDELGRVP